MQQDEPERELGGVCGNKPQLKIVCGNKPQLKIVQAKRKDLVDSAKARRQEASSKLILIFSFISNSYF